MSDIPTVFPDLIKPDSPPSVFLVKNVLILRKGESITFVTCVTVTPFIVLHVTKVDSIVAHIVISLFPILRINSADDVIMTSLK